MPIYFDYGHPCRLRWETTSSATLTNIEAQSSWSTWSYGTCTGGTSTTINVNGWFHLGYVNNDDEIRYHAQQIVAAAADVEAAREQRARSRTTARDRATELLLSFLSDEQRAAFREHGAFEVIGSHGGRYRIRRGVNGNIDWLDEAGAIGGSICAHPTMDRVYLPTPDVLLAQMLAITTDELAFARVANVHAGERPPVLRRPRRRLTPLVA